MKEAVMPDSITIRPSQSGDSFVLHNLAGQCPPLTLHTPFTYWTIVFNYSHYIFIAEDRGHPIGFISTLPSQTPDVGLFIWQVGILESYRGQGLSKRLIQTAVERHKALGRFTVTIDPTNAPSMKAFQAVASRFGSILEENRNPAFAADAAILLRDDKELVLTAALKI